MSQDPFPNTENPTLEQRLASVFLSLSAIDILPTDPLQLREGQLWYNKNADTLCVFLGGKTRHIPLEE